MSKGSCASSRRSYGRAESTPRVQCEPRERFRAVREHEIHSVHLHSVQKQTFEYNHGRVPQRVGIHQHPSPEEIQSCPVRSPLIQEIPTRCADRADMPQCVRGTMAGKKSDVRIDKKQDMTPDSNALSTDAPRTIGMRKVDMRTAVNMGTVTVPKGHTRNGGSCKEVDWCLLPQNRGYLDVEEPKNHFLLIEGIGSLER